MLGKILKQITYVVRTVTSNEVDICGAELTVRDTFPLNPESSTAAETAMRWGTTRTGAYDPEKGHYVYGEDKKPEIYTCPNDEFYVRIIGLDKRSEGGRAYKVILIVDGTGPYKPPYMCFDLREDQLLEEIAVEGIQREGYSGGKFVWAVVGSQVKMVAVGGKTWLQLKTDTEKRDTLDPISLKNLVPGKIYVQRDGSAWGHLGKVTHPDLSGSYVASLEMCKSKPWYVKDDVVSDEKWLTMTWDERFTVLLKCNGVAWRNDGGEFEYEHNIRIMKSPKFFETLDEGFSHERFVKNESVSCIYTNGKGENLSEVIFNSHGGQRPNPRSVADAEVRRSNTGNSAYVDVWSHYSSIEGRKVFDEALKKAEKQHDIDMRAERASFRDKLVWK